MLRANLGRRDKVKQMFESLENEWGSRLDILISNAYHGVLAPNARFRDQVIPQPKSGSSCPRRRKNPIPLEAATEEERRRRYTFAELLKRVFDVEVLRCPQCQGKRELVALITEAPVIRAILECLKLPADPPVMAKAGWPVGLYKHT